MDKLVNAITEAFNMSDGITPESLIYLFVFLFIVKAYISIANSVGRLNK